MYYRKIAIGVVVGAMLGGCASTGVQQLKNETAETVDAKIVKGKSTKEEIRKAFGDPTTTSFTDSGNELWRYQYTHAKSKVRNFIPIVNWFTSGADVEKKELVVFFDETGVVKNYSMQASKEESKHGILPQ